MSAHRHFWRRPGNSPAGRKKVMRFSIDSKGFSIRLPVTRSWRLRCSYLESPKAAKSQDVLARAARRDSHHVATDIRAYCEVSAAHDCRRHARGRSQVVRDYDNRRSTAVDHHSTEVRLAGRSCQSFGRGHGSRPLQHLALAAHLTAESRYAALRWSAAYAGGR